MKRVLVIAVAVMMQAGCQSDGCNVRMEAERVSVPQRAAESMREMIIKGGKDRGWCVIGNRPGCITLSLDVRNGKHNVMVDVDYGENWFSVNYLDSTNMGYNPSTGAIHGKYIQWIRNLKKDIRQMAEMSR